MEIVYEGLDISTKEKYLGFVDSINQQIQEQVINQDIIMTNKMEKICEQIKVSYNCGSREI